METMTKKQTCIRSSTPSPLAMHKDSHTISKPKPKIRIIHIFAPEIIKTDVANFRELVQRLTGKPTDQKLSCNKKPKNPRRSTMQADTTSNIKKMEIKSSTGFLGFDQERDHQKVIKEEEEEEEEHRMMWNNGENSSGFLAGFSDLEGFIQELSEFPPTLFPLDVNSHHINGFDHQETHSLALN